MKLKFWKRKRRRSKRISTEVRIRQVKDKIAEHKAKVSLAILEEELAKLKKSE